MGAAAWVCSDQTRETTSDISPVPGSTASGLPYDYYVVGRDGTFGYDTLKSAGTARPITQLEPGFFVAVLGEARGSRGDPFGLTTKGIWLPLEGLSRVSTMDLVGYDVTKGRLDRGWVITDAAPRHETPLGPTNGQADRFDQVSVFETSETRGRVWVRIGDAAWLDARDVRVPTRATRPEGVGGAERWLDVDLATQTLTAYEGDTPLFAALVSTGIGRAGEPTETPTGVHRVWAKLRTTDMTNLEEEEARRYYAIEEVPWVLFFEKGYGIHGAFWHRSFGRVRSHGCVNLAPRDAERIFAWAAPALPPGWNAVLPTEHDPGTVVRVR